MGSGRSDHLLGDVHRGSDGTPAVPQRLLGSLQGLSLHTFPVAREAGLMLHLKVEKSDVANS